MESVGVGDLSEAMIGAILCLCVQAPPGLGSQADAPTALERAMDQHLLVARAERELEFFERFASADREARARAAAVLETLRSPGAGASSPSHAAALARALRALESAPDVASGGEVSKLDRERVEDLVDCLDVQIAPGVFPADAPVDGRVVRVAIHPLYAPRERFEAELSLTWILPDGSTRLAYRGIAKPAAFEDAGFELELAAPGSKRGRYALVVELARGEARARGRAQTCEGVESLGARVERHLGELSGADDPRRALAEHVERLGERGLRSRVGLDVDAQLARLEGAPRPLEPYPSARAFASSDGTSEWIWRLDPPSNSATDTAAARTVRASLVLLAPRGEPAEAALARDAWRQAAASQGWRIESVHLPRPHSGEGSTAELFERLSPREPGVPRIVIARGETGGQLAMGLMGVSPRPYDFEVLSTAYRMSGEGPEPGPTPRLFLSPGGRTAESSEIWREGLWWFDAPALTTLGEFELPTTLTARLPACLSAAAERK